MLGRTAVAVTLFALKQGYARRERPSSLLLCETLGGEEGEA